MPAEHYAKHPNEVKMITISICDDETSETAYLSALLKSWAAARGIEIRLCGYASAEEFLFDEKKSPPDILLLDIQMSGMDGVGLAKEFRLTNKDAQIIFVTGYMEYIADGYDVEALNYLIKPVSEEKLCGVLDRAVERLSKNERVLVVNNGGVSIRVPLNEIRYLEVLHNYVTIHADEIFKIKKPLAVLEKELDSRFFRAGRSYIVNLRFVRKSTKTEIHLADGVVIPLSRGLYEALNRAIIENM